MWKWLWMGMGMGTLVSGQWKGSATAARSQVPEPVATGGSLKCTGKFQVNATAKAKAAIPVIVDLDADAGAGADALLLCPQPARGVNGRRIYFSACHWP